MKKKIQYVVGMNFGDEGKGVTTQYLCQEAIKRGEKPLVIRYCSGPQAGHTVVHNNIWHTFSSFGSGTLLGVSTYIYPLNEQTLIDPIALKAEYDVLEQKGITPEFYVSSDCTVISPYHVIANKNDDESIKNGTCGCGIWWAFEQCLNLDCDPIIILSGSRTKYSLPVNKELEEEFLRCFDFVKEHVWYPTDLMQFDTYIFESAQGLLLDGDRGFKPYVTPCEIFPHSESHLKDPFFFFEDIYDKPEVFLVTRTYMTRHGSGYEPRQYLNNINYDVFEANKDNEYQGRFKKGILDFDIINNGIQRHCLDNYDVDYNLVVTHCDCIKRDKYNNPIIPFFNENECHLNVSLRGIGKFIAEHICLNFKDIYENYSPESNLIKL